MYPLPAVSGGEGDTAVWNKIASSLAVLMSLGIAAASCVAEVDDPGAPPEIAGEATAAIASSAGDEGPLMCVDDGARVSTAEEAIARDPDAVVDARSRHRRERCFRHCEERLHDCLRFAPHGRRFRCQRWYDFCREECRRRWD